MMKKRYLAFLLAILLILSSCTGVFEPTETQNPSGDIIDPDAHTDTDNNGLCDDCGISVIVTFDFYAINDLHGRFEDTDDQPGVDELTTYLKNAYKTKDRVVLLASGDLWQGTPESNLTDGGLMTEWMNDLDFASMTLGNHEYDWGEGYIEANAETAEFPFLAINVFDSETDKLVDYATPSVIVVRGGIKIGIIGAIGDVYSSIASDNRQGVYFKTGSELTALVKAESQRLREAGCDFIVYSLHDGYSQSSSGVKPITGSKIASYYDTELSNGYVDLVFEGHTHRSYILKDEYGVYHLQNGAENDGIAHVEVSVNFANSNSKIKKAEIVSSNVYDDCADDPIVASLLAKYGDQIAKGKEIVGTNLIERDGDTLRLLIAKLYYLIGDAYWGEDYDIVLGGGYLSVRNPYSLSAGEITYGDLYTLFPFDNQLVLCSIQGKYLDSVFFVSPSANYFYYYEGYGASVKGNVDPNATYYVIVDSYSSTYAPNHMTEIERFESGIYARDLLTIFAQQGGFEQSDILGFTPNADPTPPTTIVEALIPEILAAGAALEPNCESEVEYATIGTVSRITGDYYGNMYIVDEYGNELYIYGALDSTGSLYYGDMTEKPVEGDQVILVGRLKKYVSSSGEVTIELVNARIMDFGLLTPDPDPEEPAEISIPDAIEIGNQLLDNEETEEEYVIEAEVLEIAQTFYGNMYLIDADGNVLYVYGTWDVTGTVRYGNLGSKPVAGDTVRLQGTIKKYVGSSGEVVIELMNGKIICYTSANPGAPDPGVPAEITIPEALAIGEKLADNGTTVDSYTVKGYIFSITNPTYGNAILMDEDGNVIVVYGLWNEDGTVRYDALSDPPTAGEYVILTAPIKKYVNANTGEITIELMSARIAGR